MTSPRAWTFITNHGRVLNHIYRYPTSTAREIARKIGVTERTTHKIISDLEAEGYLSKRKEGRRNVYSVNPDLPLRHHAYKDVTVQALLEALTSADLHEIMEPPAAENAADD